MVALLLLPILAITSLAIDLGQQYAQRRQMQNGADSAAMAGTRAVDQVRFSSAAPTSIYDAIQASVTNHLQGQVGSVQCWLVNDNQTRLSGDVCGSASAMTSGWAGAISKGLTVAGVEVAPLQTRRTFFASAIGFTTTSAKTAAAATIQTYLGGQGSPFIVCGVPAANNDAYSIMSPDGTLLPGATSINNIPLQGAQQHTCGAGAAFKGKNDSDQILVGVPCTGSGPNYDAPCDHAQGDNGNGFSQNIRDTVAGAVPCATRADPTNCDILVPVADSGIGNGTKIDMHIVGWVVMHVTGDGKGNPKYFGSIVGPGVVSGGQGGTGGVITDQTLRVIKLVS